MVQYACRAAVYGGRARCRNMMPCSVPSHRDGSAELAPRPDVVLLKVNLNKEWERRFREAGIPKLDRSPERAAVLANDHLKQAEQLGRDPFVIRERREGELSDHPEVIDSGTPVFGVNGVRNGTSIKGLVEELRASGYQLTGKPHMLARDWKPPVRLVLEFSKDGTPVESFSWELFHKLIDTVFMQVDVWANPCNERGLVVHTVNCGKRDDNAEPLYELEFDSGDWRSLARTMP